MQAAEKPTALESSRWSDRPARERPAWPKRCCSPPAPPTGRARRPTAPASATAARKRGRAADRPNSTSINFDYLGDAFRDHRLPRLGRLCRRRRARASRSPTSRSSSSIPIRPAPPLAAPALRMLDELGIPHLIFVNRIDQARGRIRDLLSALQPMSVSPLIARQIPIRDGEKVTGFVDLALERAFHYRPGKASERIEIPGELQRARGRGPHPDARAARRP